MISLLTKSKWSYFMLFWENKNILWELFYSDRLSKLNYHWVGALKVLLTSQLKKDMILYIDSYRNWTVTHQKLFAWKPRKRLKMSETDIQRMSLVGVNPNSRTLKFLNTKNNIATLTLKKQIAMFEREKTFSMTSLETKRLDTKQFLKQVKTLEHESEETKKYVGSGIEFF